MCKLYPTEPDLSIETVAGEDRKYNGHSCLIAKVTSEERGEPCTLWGKTVTEREQPLLKPSGEACTAWAGASKELVWLKWSKSRGCRRTQALGSGVHWGAAEGSGCSLSAMGATRGFCATCFLIDATGCCVENGLGQGPTRRPL